MTGSLAPVVVFAYNRPDHLRQTLDALAGASLADDSHVRVYADGPRDAAAREGVEAVRKVLADRVWHDRFRVFEVVASEANNGLAKAIITGVSDVLALTGKVIVLEDDLIVSRDFLRFMNDALDFYESDKSVGSISGFCPLQAPPRGYPHDVMRVPRNCSTGWATWADRWQEVDWSAADAARLYRDPDFRRRFNAAGSDRLDRLRRQMKGTVSSWSIRFGLWQTATGRDTIFSSVNRLINSGYDGSGVNTKAGEAINQSFQAEGSPYVLAQVETSPDVLAGFRRVYSGSPQARLRRFLRNL
jgi:hypothetical protein